jgi:diacylglycerol kinase family enzyme
MGNMELFASYVNQVFSRAIPMDVIRCGNNYATCFGMAGMEAYAVTLGDDWIKKGIPVDISYLFAGVVQLLKGKGSQSYFIEIDGNKIEGKYASILVANTPCYGSNMRPAVDAHPDDGLLNVYTVKNASKLKLLTCIPAYTSGGYRKKPHLVTHYPARKIKVSSDQTMCMNVDGEYFYGMSIEYEIIPKAIRFVCPDEIDLAKLPLIYGKPKEGLRNYG